MKPGRLLAIFAAILLLACCTRVIEETPSRIVRSFTVTFEENKAVGADGSVRFNAGEVICLWNSVNGNLIVKRVLEAKDISEGGRSAFIEFEISEDQDFFAIYPLPAENVFRISADGFTFSPSGTDGIARATGNTATGNCLLKNITSLMEYECSSLPEGCSGLRFKGNNGEKFLTDNVLIDLRNGSILKGDEKSFIDLTPKDGRNRFSIIPGVKLDKGFTIEFLSSDGKVLESVASDSAYTIGENEYIRLGDILWKELGTAEFHENGLFNIRKGCELSQSRTDANHFRIASPFQGKDKYLEFSVEAGGKLSFTNHDTGVTNPQYGKNYTMCYQESPFNMVDYRQDNGLPGQVQLAPDYVMEGIGKYIFSNENDVVKIVFPGAEYRDYRATVENVRILLDENTGRSFFHAELTPGNGVESLRYTVVKGEDPSAASPNDYVTDEGKTSVKWELEGKGSGIYTLAYETICAGKAVRKGSASAVRYDLNAMESMGWCAYTDDIFTILFSDLKPQTYRVELLRDKEEKAVFYLKNPYGNTYPSRSIFTSTSSDNVYLRIDCSKEEAVSISRQPLGCDCGYGECFIYSSAAGSLAEGKLTFPSKALKLGMEGTGEWSANLSSAFCIDMNDLQPQAPVSFVLRQKYCNFALPQPERLLVEF